MKGSYWFKAKSKKVLFEFSIRRNITIIKGDSATGKTILLRILYEYLRIGRQSGYAVSTNASYYVYIRDEVGRDWKDALYPLKNTVIFIEENNEFVFTKEFASYVKESGNYFVFVTRAPLKMLPYSIHEIYEIITDVLLVFPTNHKKNSTVRILKTPKTESSVRKIFLPKSVANMLVDWKAEQDEMKEILGDEYMDYNLVMASTFGLPLGDGAIRGPLKKLIEDYNLPPVVFHSFRHSSVTYKLKLNGGDIKAVQGDSGHAQVNMVTDVYSHILDDDRRKNAELFEEAFYEKKNLDPQMHVQQENNNATVADEVDPELLAKVLANPEMRALLNSLAKTMK